MDWTGYFYMLYDLLMIGAGVVLTLGTALFVASEFSLVALDPATVDRRAAAGDKRASSVSKTMHHLSTHLSGAQVGITLTTIMLGYTTQTAVADMIDRSLRGLGVAVAISTTVGVAAAVIVVNVFSMVFGELVPKNFALAETLKVAGIVSPVQRAFTFLFRPLIGLLNGSANMVLRAVGVEPLEQMSSARSASELAAMVRHSAEEGTLDTSTASMFTRSVRMGRLTAADIMVDRGRMDTLEATNNVEDLIDLARKTGRSRFPVIGEDTDDILGIAHLRRAAAVPFAKRGEVPVTSQSIMFDAMRVPETVQLAPLMVALREEGLQMAIVVDEYGGTSGFVTLEDIVEEIVGEIADEHDPKRRGIRIAGQNGWYVSGLVRPDELHDYTKLRVPDDGPYDTLGGLIMDRLGAIPKEGDYVDVNHVRLQVTGMDGRRVDQVLVQPTKEV
ncbi:MAG: hemolysin family protein [Winkia sp. UMB750A]|uniref:hemolysin family protein n=2 Tax=Bacillati TaxID=1783272 RepID=UPI0025563821|nr:MULTISPECIES: hemolysin family protein [unclassified Winkia]MDK8224128.1 hemolysin family protein [Winkia sp. UMB750B]MDK8257066.1 hemolysin family protein [Winkia sp. UMB750A]